MSLEQNVMADMKDAMKAKNEAALRSLRAIKAAIIIATITHIRSFLGIQPCFWTLISRVFIDLSPYK